VTPGAVHTVAGVLVFAVGLNGCGARVSISPEHAQSAEQLARDQSECEAEVQTVSRNVATAGKALVMVAGGAVAGVIVGGVLGLGAGLTGDSVGSHPEKQILLAAFVGSAVGAVAGAILLPKKVVEDERDARAKEFQRCMEERGYSVAPEPARRTPQLPVEPKPPAPRALSGSVVTSTNSTCSTRCTIS